MGQDLQHLQSLRPQIQFDTRPRQPSAREIQTKRAKRYLVHKDPRVTPPQKLDALFTSSVGSISQRLEQFDGTAPSGSMGAKDGKSHRVLQIQKNLTLF